MNEEEVILNLIKQGCGDKDSVFEDKVFRMAQILNIQRDNYEKVKMKLLETGKINHDNGQIFLL